ncbi:FAD-dependent oxidoreductase [Streptomyces silvensis]|uniref:FAD-binding domain-containing protein n=1 Tax=Streptomyces silvensis TaxID=1765722 RepID=A0A0W7WXD2_9ACTN|nr:NAD(P)/FAD-dependent oxidoreductase [Streptomyces silvensis]KUF15159.1 hypothetical protein AT728_27320 [Streptomyces silvensis]
MPRAQPAVDVTVVGGGIAGSALAGKLAAHGLDVLVLEKSLRFRDRVRGETLMPWGVAEARRLGLEETLLRAGGSYAGAMVACGDGVSYAQAGDTGIDLSTAIPGIPGPLNVGHPDASTALLEHAAASGAHLVREAQNIRVHPGEPGAVTYEAAGERHQVRSRMIVGADGRHSTTRRQAGISLTTSTPRTYCAGLLLGGLPWPTGENAAATEGDAHYLAFPRRSGLVRTYVFWAAARGNQLRGPDAVQRYLGLLKDLPLPAGCDPLSAIPKGPCAVLPMNDSWIGTGVNIPGLVLIGDAAGWSDPLIGQGLSIALRDARSVAEALTADRNWPPDIFHPYHAERSERMRRLRISAHIATELRCTFSDEGRRRRRSWNRTAQRDVRLSGPLLGNLAGPETVPAEAFDASNIGRIIAFGHR